MEALMRLVQAIASQRVYGEDYSTSLLQGMEHVFSFKHWIMKRASKEI